MDETSVESYKEGYDFPNKISRQFIKRKDNKWYHDVADFANLLKSFIGTNYLSLAYGVSLAGLGLGIGGLILVATLTAHCCRLIVKVKYHVIEQVLQRSRPLGYSDSITQSASEEKAMFRHLQRTMTYSDVGRVAYGRWGGRLVLFFLVITQIGFCVNYHIFIGSNIYSMIAPPARNQTTGNCTAVSGSKNLQIAGVYIESSDALDLHQRLPVAESPHSVVDLLDMAPSEKELAASAFGTVNRGGGKPSAQSNNTTVAPPGGDGGDTTWIPPLTLLVALPLPICLLFTLFRNVRVMGFISLIANITMSAGYIMVIAYIFSSFKLADNLQWFKWTTFPVFLGQATSSYEAIGTLLSIEASMDGNHHRYPACLYSVVGVFSTMLSLSAVLGYLRYGEDTAQILVQNLPQSGAMIVVVNVALVVAVLFTYPLQVYPVIEILEGALFAEGGCCGQKRGKSNISNSQSSSDSSGTDETQPLLDSGLGKDIEECIIVKVIPASVATWKRNVFRVSVAVLIAGLGVIFKDVFAYVNAFVGAIGSCPLAFVLPCVFHLKLCWHQLSRAVIFKDVVIILVGVIVGFISLFVVVQQLVEEMSASSKREHQCMAL